MYKGAEFQFRLFHLRAEYDAAFATLCRAIADLQSAVEFGFDGPDMRAAEKEAERARAACTRARNALAEILLERKFQLCPVFDLKMNRNGRRRKAAWKTGVVRINRPATRRDSL